MDKAEMRALLRAHMDSLRLKTYAELAACVADRHVDLADVDGPSGAVYQVEVCFVWDDRRGGDVRVLASIDESPSRPLLGFLPIYVSAVTDSFIMRPDGSFAGE